MSIAEILLISIAVAMDAFAVAVCRGLAAVRVGWGEAVRVGVWFGAFQALMPLLGILLMLSCRRATPVAVAAPYIASALLFGIGGNMIVEALRSGATPAMLPALGAGEMCLLALATSVDAFASGVAMGCTVTLPTALAATLTMGVVTCFACLIGVLLGGRIGEKIGHRGELLGGGTLVLLGLKLLLEALGVVHLPF